MNTSITSKGQVTIPKKVRQFLGAKSGDKIEWKIHYDTDMVTVIIPKEKPKIHWREKLKQLQKTYKTNEKSLVESLQKDREKDLQIEKQKLNNQTS